mmetsp:Transcript_9958/g.20593  ORF Transcript_9958/g.20593 Transcript_9958/m.20593 type:complete len:97 (+) Transcript_9958:1349-1639(+)
MCWVSDNFKDQATADFPERSSGKEIHLPVTQVWILKNGGAFIWISMTPLLEPEPREQFTNQAQPWDLPSHTSLILLDRVLSDIFPSCVRIGRDKSL